MVILVLVVAQILPNCTVIISALLQSGQIIIDLFRGVAASIRNDTSSKSSRAGYTLLENIQNLLKISDKKWLKISQNGQLQNRHCTAAGFHTADYCSTAAPAATGGGFIEFLEPQFVVGDNTWHFRSVWAFLRFSVVINSGGRNAPTHGAFRRRVTIIVQSKNNFIRLDISTRHCINGGYQLCATK